MTIQRNQCPRWIQRFENYKRTFHLLREAIVNVYDLAKYPPLKKHIDEESKTLFEKGRIA